jgi:hypothetical protein
MSLTRELRFSAAKSAEYTEGADLVVDMSFASAAPYERWWGVEVLDCSPAAVNLSRLNDGGALLFNHDWNDLRGHHVPGTVRADADNVVRGQVAISWAADNGKTIKLVAGGHLTKTSTGYEIHEIEEQSAGKSRSLDGQLFDRTLTRCHAAAPGDVAAFRRALDAAAGTFERAADEPTTYVVKRWEILETAWSPCPPTKRWASAAVTHPKPNPSQFRSNES